MINKGGRTNIHLLTKSKFFDDNITQYKKKTPETENKQMNNINIRRFRI